MDQNDRVAMRASKQARLHLILIVVWALLVPPTLLFWSQSVTWVLMISIYANIVSHWGAYQAAHAEKTGAQNP